MLLVVDAEFKEQHLSQHLFTVAAVAEVHITPATAAVAAVVASKLNRLD